MRFSSRLAIVSTSIVALVVPAAGQLIGGRTVVHFQVEGERADTYLGHTVRPVGDIDADGIPDFGVGAPIALVAGSGRPGTAFFYSGATGQLLWKANGSADGDRFGSSISGIGDVDNDGIRDVAIGGPGSNGGSNQHPGFVSIRSGATGLELHHLVGTTPLDAFGAALASLSDVDGDGIDDLAVGAPRASPSGMLRAGSVSAISAASGALLYRIDGVQGDYLGECLDNTLDANGDGHLDLVISAPGADVPGVGPDAGAAWLVSGATGSLIHEFSASELDTGFASAVAGAGDVDGDGAGDVIVGSPGKTVSGQRNAGAAYVYSGNTGSHLGEILGAGTNQFLGKAVAGAGDADGDGLDDVIVGAWGTSFGGSSWEGSVYVASVSRRSILFRIDGEQGYQFGEAVCSLGDLDSDGLDEQAASSTYYSSQAKYQRGAVIGFGVDPFLTVTPETISVSAGTVAELRIDFPTVDAGKRYVVLASLTGAGPTQLGTVAVPLSSDRLFARMLTGWTAPNSADTVGTLDLSGNGTARVWAAPSLVTAVGRSAFLAAVSFEPGSQSPVRSSIARRMYVAP